MTARPASAPAPADDQATDGGSEPALQGPAPPVYRTRLAPAQRLRFAVRLGARQGVGEWTWEPQPAQRRYRADLVATGDDGRPLVEWHSQGGLDDAGVAPERFVVRRAGRGRAAVNFQRDAGLISFSGPRHALPLVEGAQDRLSWLAQLAAIVDAEAAAFARPGRRIEMVVAGARGDVAVWSFEVQGLEALARAGTAAPALALRLRREPQRPYDTRAEVWLDPADHHLPLRLRLTHAPAPAVIELERLDPPRP